MADENKVVIIEDTDVKFITLSRGLYLIDGEVVRVNNSTDRAAVKNEKDIRLVSVTGYISEYVNPSGESITPETYKQEKAKLLEQAKIYADESHDFGDNLEAEYAYKIFTRNWKEVWAERQIVSDPILVEIERIKQDTGNPFIRNMFLNGDPNNTKYNLYVYNRDKAYKHILTEYMTELGFTYSPSERYNVDTEWTNSNHSGIRYAKAFGEYLFGRGYDNVYSKNGTLEELEKTYESDKAELRKIVKVAYVSKFGSADARNFNFGELVRNLYTIRNKANAMDYKVKDRQKHVALVNMLTQLIKKIEAIVENMEVNKED